MYDSLFHLSALIASLSAASPLIRLSLQVLPTTPPQYRNLLSISTPFSMASSSSTKLMTYVGYLSLELQLH